MAYFTQEMKKAIAPKIKAIAAKHGVKASLSVAHHTEVVLTITSGKIDFIKNANEIAKARCEMRGERHDEIKNDIQVNQYHIDSHFSDEAAACLSELNEVLNTGNWDKSDAQTDYFNVGFYVSINVGRWNKPYAFEA